jgi:hypothetical protein
MAFLSRIARLLWLRRRRNDNMPVKATMDLGGGAPHDLMGAHTSLLPKTRDK